MLHDQYREDISREFLEAYHAFPHNFSQEKKCVEVRGILRLDVLGANLLLERN